MKFVGLKERSQMRKHESGNRKRSLGWKPGAGKLEVNVTMDSEPISAWLHDQVLEGGES